MTAPDAAKPIKHYTATVLILTDNKPTKALLMHHRKTGRWMPPGGHQEAWENPIEAAIRETLEESGLDISQYLPPVVPVDEHSSQLPVPRQLLQAEIPAHGNEPAHYHLDQMYVVHVPEQVVTNAAAEAHDIRWFAAADIGDLPLFDDIRTILKQELNK